MEEWIFSLFDRSDPNDTRITTLVTRQAIQTQTNRYHQDTNEEDIATTLEIVESEQSTTKELKEIHEDNNGGEETSLLMHPNGLPCRTKTITTSTTKSPQPLVSTTNCSWKFTGPSGLELQSDCILKLSYVPTWQTLPEYTKGSVLSSCFCGGELLGGRRPDTLLEVYTSKDIVQVRKLDSNTGDSVIIRGLGQCQAIQIYLKQHKEATMGGTVFGIQGAPEPYPASVRYHKDRMAKQRLPSWSRFTEPSDTGLSTNSSENESFDGEDHIIVTFAIPLNTESKYDPPLLWKVEIPYEPSHENLVLDTITVFDGMLNVQPNNDPPTHIYIQGYQSWSFTGSVVKGKPQPISALPNVFSRAFNLGGVPPPTPTMVVGGEGNERARIANNIYTYSGAAAKPKQYRSDFFTCITTGHGDDDGTERNFEKIMDEVGGPALLLGWLSQHEQFGILNVDKDLKCIEMHASHKGQVLPDKVISTDWAYGQLVSPHHYDEEPMVHYLHAVAAYNEARPLQNGSLLTGWCSWYHYYENISAGNLRLNFSRLDGMRHVIPTNVSVVDDGYMTAWGDWDSLKPGKFTTMDVVSRDIRASHMRPGLWLAPFACDKHSEVARLHPDWIIRNEQGRPSNSSYCGKFFYGLDATNPNVREYVRLCVRRAVQQWGFSVLKIDFLYAACLEGNGKFDMSMSRAKAMHLALQTIREAAGPDVFLIGCGCPVGTGVGYVDGMRISADTGPTWNPPFPLPRWDDGTLPALRAMVRNSINRAPFGHRWWHNDPDCLLLGYTTKLTDDEVASACSIVAMTCGMILLSDDLAKVKKSRMEIVTRIFPMTGASAVVLDLHSTRQGSMPKYLRLWCTDKYNAAKQFRQSNSFRESLISNDRNAEATYYGRKASFSPNDALPHPNERKRSCIHVAKGLGTWTLISVSNWTSKEEVMTIPFFAFEAIPDSGWGQTSGDLNSKNCTSAEGMTSGYHVFAFWSSRYKWIPYRENTSAPLSSTTPLHHLLRPHQTEIFHIKPVTPDKPQYIGSDLHFSCGQEVLDFQIVNHNKLTLKLKTELQRSGHVFLFLPTVDTSHLKVTKQTKDSTASVLCPRWNIVANTPNEGTLHCCGRILRIHVDIRADSSAYDGEYIVDF